MKLSPPFDLGPEQCPLALLPSPPFLPGTSDSESFPQLPESAGNFHFKNN